MSFYKVKNVTNTGAFGEQWVGSVSQENKKKRGRGGGGGGGGVMEILQNVINGGLNRGVGVDKIFFDVMK